MGWAEKERHFVINLGQMLGPTKNRYLAMKVKGMLNHSQQNQSFNQCRIDIYIVISNQPTPQVQPDAVRQ